MKVEKTIVCRVLGLTDRRMGLLVKEYSNAQGYIRGETDDLYSATRQAMDRYVEKVQNEEYPLFLRNDTFRVEKAESSEEFDYWARIPISDVWGGVWVPIEPHREIREDMDIHDSKIVRFVNKPITEAFMKKEEVNPAKVLGTPFPTNKLS